MPQVILEMIGNLIVRLLFSTLPILHVVEITFTDIFALCFSLYY